jgi:hypothetical protein
LIEYETGSASVRNDQHKSATLAKMARYAECFAMYTGNDFKTTLYGTIASGRSCSVIAGGEWAPHRLGRA